MFLQLEREAKAQGATLAVTLMPSPCYDRMKQAIRSVSAHIERRENGLHVKPGVIMSESRWKEFQKTDKECAQ
jgi:hypothetical protein